MTIEELCQATARELARRGLAQAQPDGRVTDAPDVRTVRYYGTLGLLPRPRIVGRQASYDVEHVNRLVAVKALQRQGWSLAKIQQWLWGRTDEELQAVIETATPAAVAAEPPCATLWREIILTPGLKLLAASDWTPPADSAALEARFHAALAALRTTDDDQTGGSRP